MTAPKQNVDQNVDFGKTASGLHVQVCAMMDAQPRGRVLDAPSGTGALSAALRDMGFDVTAGDIDPAVVRTSDIDVRQMDLNGALPFPDQSFDYIINVEGLEHLENPHHTIREFARILKPGGAMILTTPNVLNVFSRWRYLLIGYHAHFGDYYADEDNFYVLHINPVGLPEIDLALRRSDLTIEEVAANRSVTEGRGFLMRVWLKCLRGLIRIATARKVVDERMRSYFCQEAVLTGEILIVQCRKKGGNCA